MGVLIAKRYPTKMFADLADHTYVECGTGGKAWSCWGGKSGGTALRSGSGSTVRADQIAGTNERAGITCYLVNGVCHQAANRILIAAGITVRGARGYEVSEAMFGTYGRPGWIFGLCKAPFDQHSGTTGDLTACMGAGGLLPAAKRLASSRSTARTGESQYLRGVLKIYGRARAPLARGLRAVAKAGSEIEDFHVALFMHQVDFKLASNVDRTLDRRLRRIRRSAERSRLKLDEWFGRREISATEYAHEFDNETKAFQHAAAGVLRPAQYKKLFELERSTTVTLADPRILKKADLS